MKPNPNNPTLTTTPPTRHHHRSRPRRLRHPLLPPPPQKLAQTHTQPARRHPPRRRHPARNLGQPNAHRSRRPRRRLTRHANPRYHTIPQDTDMQHILPKHGTRAYGYPTVAGCNANRTPITCPFCSGPTIVDGPHIIIHREYLGYTLCPASGKTPTEGAVLATALLDDYLLPNESSYSATDQ